jgi:hypothetical protein
MFYDYLLIYLLSYFDFIFAKKNLGLYDLIASENKN